MSKKIYNNLIDFVIMAGFDQDTGLTLIEGQHFSIQSISNDIFKAIFEPSVLAVISNDTAHYPKSSVTYNLAYPPLSTRKLVKETSVTV
jgi:hypothetical protein